MLSFQSRLRKFLPLFGLLAAACSSMAESTSSYPAGARAPNASAAPAGDVQAGETYAKVVENDFVDASQTPVSTFAIDVDTASYTLMRRDITAGRAPVADGVRPEEYLNYFHYDYPAPQGPHPFAVHVDGAPTPFGQGLHVLRVGLQGRKVEAAQRKAVNLVFLIDVSGSMSAANKLPLVQYSLNELVKRLQPSDTLGIVVYAGRDAVVLDPTPVSNKSKITDAINQLQSGGGTNGEAGIRKAYALAESAKKQDGINRVVLCTDGDFNVGATGEALVRIVEEEREKGIFLTTLGFGEGNYNDREMQELADRGNGNYGYIDTQGEAVRMLGDKLVSTLEVIAKDVKIQVEFDPKAVKRYRLIGYENRLLANEDFKNDKKDAGELGAGHSVTALYEVELLPAATQDLATVRFRYKQPQGDTAAEFETKVGAQALAGSLDGAAPDLRFATAVAEYAEILRGSKHSEGKRFADVLRLVDGTVPADDDRKEFRTLVDRASTMVP